MVREENEKDSKGEMSDWDDQAGAVVGVAQRASRVPVVSQSSAIPTVQFQCPLPAFLRPSSDFLSSLKILTPCGLMPSMFPPLLDYIHQDSTTRCPPKIH